MRNYSPPSLRSFQGKMLGAWDADSRNSHGQVLVKLLTNISPTMTLPTFFARFVSCKSLLSNFYKHNFCSEENALMVYTEPISAIGLSFSKKHKVAKSIMNGSSAYHTAKQQLSRIQCKRAPDIDIVIKLIHELIWEKYKKVNEFSQECMVFTKQCILSKDSGNSFWGFCCPTTLESQKNLCLYCSSNILGWIIMVQLERGKCS